MIAFLLLGVFFVFAYLMYSGKLHVLLALPVLAVAITVVTAFPYYFSQSHALHPGTLHQIQVSVFSTYHLVLDEIIAKGIPRLHGVMLSVMLGGIFGFFLKVSGVTESLVRKIAELAGHHPFVMMASLSAIVSLLFTTLGGLGSVILVATIYFPVLLSQGIPPLIIASGFLMSVCIGGTLNIVDWALYMDILGLSTEHILRFALPFCVIYYSVFFSFLVIEFKRAKLPVPMGMVAKVVGVIAGAVILWVGFAHVIGNLNPAWILGFKVAYVMVLFGLMVAPLLGFGRTQTLLLAPVVPISLVFILGWSVNAAFLMGLVYLFVISKHRIQWTLQSAVEGIQAVAPAIAIMMGIGMVLIAVNTIPIQHSVLPFLGHILPHSAIGYLLFFGAFAPLALYRGPLNIWGMGSGVIGLIQSGSQLSPFMIMGAFMSTGQIQGVCDPTNTHNVWIANQLKVDLQAILRKTLPYIWVVAIGGLGLAVWLN